MVESPKSNEISRHVVATFDLLRHSFSPVEIVQYVLALAFLRWLTELKRHQNDEGDTVQLWPAQSSCTYVEISLPSGDTYDLSTLTKSSRDLGVSLNSVFRSLEQRNPVELSGVFRTLDFSNLKFARPNDKSGLLRELIGCVSEEKLTTHLDGRPENLLERYIDSAADSLVSGFYAPEFNTPKSVCRLVAKLMAAHGSESIYDPACGSGQLLLACANGGGRVGIAELSLAGGEINHAAWALAKINLLSHGYSSAGLLLVDSLNDYGVPTLGGKQRKFEVVVAHPPWSMKNWRDDGPDGDRYNRFSRGLPPRSNADYAFILHMVSCMNAETGRMAVIVSSGVLSRSGPEGDIRRQLITENLIDVVIGLPEKLFQGSPIAGAILVLRHGRTTTDVLFVDARRQADFGRSRNVLSVDTVNLLATIAESRAAIPQLSALVSRADIENNKFSLSVPLYVREVQGIDYPPLDEVRRERVTAELELRSLCREINDQLKSLGHS